jgi:hypothetical protein
MNSLQFLQTELYTELIQKPLWTVSAFQDVDKSWYEDKFDTRYLLVKYLVRLYEPRLLLHFDTVPHYTPRNFEETVDAAVSRCIEILVKFDEEMTPDSVEPTNPS